MAPFIRIILRYGTGVVFGIEVGDMLAGDPDVVSVASAAAYALIGVANELWYRYARKTGGEL